MFNGFQGEKKQTNYHRTMVSQLVKGIIPDSWKAYTVPRGATVIQWVTDFAQRVRQLQEISQQVAQFGSVELKVKKITYYLPVICTRKMGDIFEYKYNAVMCKFER